MSGTTRSSDWRLRSTIHSTSPRRGDHRIDERLPDGALVELGVADERDVAAALRHVEVAGDVAVRDRAPERRRRADADRAGREVDDARILGAARIALQPAELAQRRQVAAVERAEQVVDRVQHGRGVRLDRDAVGRAQVLEVERRHDADHRGRRRLVAADLDARRRRRAPCSRGARCSSRATARAAAPRRAPSSDGAGRRRRRRAHRERGIGAGIQASAGGARGNACRSSACHARFERDRAIWLRFLAWTCPDRARARRDRSRDHRAAARERPAAARRHRQARASLVAGREAAPRPPRAPRGDHRLHRRASTTRSSAGRSRPSPSCASPARRRSTRSPASPSTSPRSRRSSRPPAIPTRSSGSASRTSPTSSASSTCCAAAAASPARRR